MLLLCCGFLLFWHKLQQMGRLSSKLLGTYECPQEKLPFFYSSRHLKNKFLHKLLSMQQALYKIINILLQKPIDLSFVQKFSLLCPHFQSTSVRVNTEVFLLLHFFFHDVNRIHSCFFWNVQSSSLFCFHTMLRSSPLPVPGFNETRLFVYLMQIDKEL